MFVFFVCLVSIRNLAAELFENATAIANKRKTHTRTRTRPTQHTALATPKPESRKLEVWPRERLDVVVTNCCWVRRALPEGRLDHSQTAWLGVMREKSSLCQLLC